MSSSTGGCCDPKGEALSLIGTGSLSDGLNEVSDGKSSGQRRDLEADEAIDAGVDRKLLVRLESGFVVTSVDEFHVRNSPHLRSACLTRQSLIRQRLSDRENRLAFKPNRPTEPGRLTESGLMKLPVVGQRRHSGI